MAEIQKDWPWKLKTSEQRNASITVPHLSGSGGGSFMKVQDFSLVLGGPLFQLLRRARLSDDAMTMVHRRVIVISLLAWLPLLILSALESHLLENSVAVPFLADIEVHIRFLVVLPLLIVAEYVVHQRMCRIGHAFLERKLVPDAAMPRFNEAMASAFRLRNSVLAEVLLLVLVYGVGVLIVWRQYTALDTTTWYGLPSWAGADLSLAGLWYGYVSLPIFQFLLVRWYFRLLIWMRFLWQVSRIDLQLIPTHPDRVGGVGFLSNTIYAFAPLVLAHGAMLAGQFANRIVFLGAELPDFKMEIVAIAIFLLCIVLGPLLVFSPQLERTKRTGLGEYGVLAAQYVRQFDLKWLRAGAPRDESLLGSSDLQSLADMNHSYGAVRNMRLAPFGRDAILLLAAFLLAPIAPLLLTLMPLEDLLKQLFGLMF